MSDDSLDTTNGELSASLEVPGDAGGRTGRRWVRAGAAVVGGALLVRGLRRRSLGGAAMALAGGWLTYRAVTGPGRRARPADSVTVTKSITVGRSADELSELVRETETLDRIAGPFADVTAAGEDRHRWTVEGPLDRELSWETAVTEDQQGELLRWEPLEGAAWLEDWSVHFGPTPGDRGTKVTLRIRFDPSSGPPAGGSLERLGVVPETLAGAALDRFKSLAETGEIPTTERNPSARGKGDLV